MLKNIYLKNFTIISELSLDFFSGLTVLTGETGAGKSVLLDALEIALGERGDVALIQHGSERCEISVSFAVAGIEPAQQWLLAQDMDEAEDECVLRRVISRDGRSRSSINGRPCTLQQVRELGALLVHIHGQNKHSLLLKSNYQWQLLDGYAQLQSLNHAVRDCYEQWRQAQDELERVRSVEGQEAQKELLNFQLQELQQLDLAADEWPSLLKEQQQLAHAEQWINACHGIMNILETNEHNSALYLLHAAHNQLGDLSQRSVQVEKVDSALELVNQAIIQTQEAHNEVRDYLESLETDPERLQAVEQRLALIHNVARKHKIKPEEILQKQQELQEKLQHLQHLDQDVAAIEERIQDAVKSYASNAELLTAARRQASHKLQEKISRQIAKLGMAHGELSIQLSPVTPASLHPFGNEHIEFLVRTNPGQPLQPLAKIASGGELSRIALAIQVVTVQENTLPSIIFDEVDVGVGGRTAQIVGEQLKKLARNAQVLCVTHLPQVAAQGQQHLQIEKIVKKNSVNTVIRLLTAEERVQEIARMLGGINMTETTLAHAREMLLTDSAV